MSQNAKKRGQIVGPDGRAAQRYRVTTKQIKRLGGADALAKMDPDARRVLLKLFQKPHRKC